MSTTPLEAGIASAIRSAMHGDRAAFEHFVALTQGMVTAVALAITTDRTASEDIAQETFLETWQRLPTLHDEWSVMPWVRQVARNKAIDVLRRRAHPAGSADSEELTLLVCPQGQPPEVLEAEQQIARVVHALQELPSATRETVLLFYREGERSQQVASLLGVSDAVVRKRLQRARALLHSELAAEVRAFALAGLPGSGVAATVSAGLAALSPPATAGVVGASGGTTAWIATGLKGLTTGVAAVGVVVLAVVIDTRMALARTRDPRKRRQLVAHGAIYAGLLAGYLLALNGVPDTGARSHWIAGLAAVAVVAIFGLAAWRARIARQ